MVSLYQKKYSFESLVFTLFCQSWSVLPLFPTMLHNYFEVLKSRKYDTGKNFNIVLVKRKTVFKCAIVTENERKMKPSPKHLDRYSSHCCLNISLTSTHHELAWRLWPMHIIQVSLLNIAETGIFNISKLFKAFPKAMPALPRIQLLEKELCRYCSAHLAK